MDDRENAQIALPSGATVGLAEYGDPQGCPMFFYHGWPSSRRQARLCDRSASDHGIRIIAMDRPGIGRSTFQPNRQLLDWPPFIAELADGLGIDRFSVLAVSGGGPYALATSLAMPKRLEAVGIVSGAPPLSMFKDRGDLHPCYRLLYITRKLAPWSMSLFLPIARRIAKLPPKSLLIKTLTRGIPQVDRAAVLEPEAFSAVADSFVDASLNGMKPLITDGDIYLDDWGFPLGDIHFPIQFWHGERDCNIPCRMAREVAAAIPSAVTKWFPEDGHYSLPILRLDEIFEALLAQGRLAA
jgi:pimeloyl-ACP methyl ester carboxylesterase